MSMLILTRQLEKKKINPKNFLVHRGYLKPTYWTLHAREHSRHRWLLLALTCGFDCFAKKNSSIFSQINPLSNLPALNSRPIQIIFV